MTRDIEDNVDTVLLLTCIKALFGDDGFNRLQNIFSQLHGDMAIRHHCWNYKEMHENGIGMIP